MNKESTKKSPDGIPIDLICVGWTGAADMEGSHLTAAKDLALLALALYGAILSTINWRHAARREATQIKLVIGMMRPATGSQPGPSYARVEAINVCQRTVMIEILTLELPSGARMFTPYTSGIAGLESTRLPASLDDGETARYVVSCEEIGRALRSHGLGRGTKLTPVCVDTAGRVYKGKPWEVDPDELLRMATSQ
jgi:hypothetical protein